MTLSKQFQNSAYESVLWVSSLSPPCLAIECSPLVPIVHSTLFWIIIKFDVTIMTSTLLLTSFSHLSLGTFWRWHDWFGKGWMESFCGLLSPLDLIAHPPAKHLHTHIARILTEQNQHFKKTWIISMVMVMKKIQHIAWKWWWWLTAGQSIFGCLSRSFVLPRPTKQERERAGVLFCWKQKFCESKHGQQKWKIVNSESEKLWPMKQEGEGAWKFYSFHF